MVEQLSTDRFIDKNADVASRHARIYSTNQYTGINYNDSFKAPM